MKQYSRKYGQVFLVNNEVAKFEVSLLDEGQRVLEIGPGTGILTELLLEKFPKVTVIESDHRFIDILKAKFFDMVSSGRLSIIHGNFLEYNTLDYEQIIGNIPYHISSQIVQKLTSMNFKKAVIMVQKEFAQTIMARASTSFYTKLSVFAQTRFNLSLERTISASNFNPQPSVDSAIISLYPKNYSYSHMEDYGEVMLGKLFSQKRKKIKNVMPNAPLDKMELRIDQLSPEEIMEMLDQSYKKSKN